jgi:exopolysaccharide production protein ExoZ
MTVLKQVTTLYSLELARGLAALLILIYHLSKFDPNHPALLYLMPLHPFLSSGVDLFFIISGFLMVHTTRDTANRHPLKFIIKRCIRIYPTYWLVLTPLVVMLAVYPQWFPTLIHAKASIFHSTFLLPHKTPLILSLAWTLVFEVYFYAVFALTLFLKPKTQHITLMLFFMACFCTGLWVTFDDAFLQLLTSPLLLEFMAGMILAVLWPFIRVQTIAPAALSLLMAIMLFALPGMTISIRPVSQGIPSMFLILAFLQWEKYDFPPAWKTPALISGGVSYPLYLIHMPIIGCVMLAAKHLHIQTGHLGLTLSFIAITSLIAAAFIHYAFEVPVQTHLRRWFDITTRQPQQIRLDDQKNGAAEED